jgi:hypothetical protein
VSNADRPFKNIRDLFGRSMKTENITGENPITVMFHVQNSLKHGPVSSSLFLILL